MAGLISHIRKWAPDGPGSQSDRAKTQAWLCPRLSSFQMHPTFLGREAPLHHPLHHGATNRAPRGAGGGRSGDWWHSGWHSATDRVRTQTWKPHSLPTSPALLNPVRDSNNSKNKDNSHLSSPPTLHVYSCNPHSSPNQKVLYLSPL